MRVIYAVPIELDTPGGNLQHVLGICRHAAKSGIDLHLICLKGKGSLPIENFKITAIPSEGLGAIGRIRLFSQKSLELIKTQKDADWVYFRPFPLDFYFFSRHLLKLKRRYAYELNTLWADELRSQSKPFKAILYPWLESLSLKNANALLPVTQEIADHAKSVGGGHVPYLVAGNGIDIPSEPNTSIFELRKKWNLPESKKLVVMAGFSRPWHGYEKLLAALKLLSTDWHVVLVGSESEELTKIVLKKCAALDLQGRVHVLPWLKHKDVDEVVYASDVGISPLALEAKKMKEAQSLKVRHYLAMGIPVVIAGGEAAVLRNQSFVRMITDTRPESLALAIESLKSLRDLALIRSFAIKNLSWESVAKKTFDFLKNIKS